MELKTKDAKEMAQEVGMSFFVSENGSTAMLYYENLDIPDELHWAHAVLDIFVRQNSGVTVTAMTEIHRRLTGKTLWYKIRNLFRKPNPIGVLIVYKKG